MCTSSMRFTDCVCVCFTHAFYGLCVCVCFTHAFYGLCVCASSMRFTDCVCALSMRFTDCVCASSMRFTYCVCASPMRNRTVCFTHRLQAVQAPQGFKGCGELTAADLAMEPARSRSPGNAADQGVCMGVGVGG